MPISKKDLNIQPGAVPQRTGGVPKSQLFGGGATGAVNAVTPENSDTVVSGKALLPHGKDASFGQKALNVTADIAGSRGFGETIGGLLANKGVQKRIGEANDLKFETEGKLIAEIRKKREAGEDTTRLIDALKLSASEKAIDPLDVNPVLKKTNKQVAGEALEFAAGSIGAIFGGGALAKGGAAVKAGGTGFGKIVATQAGRSALEGGVAGIGIGLQDPNAGAGKPLALGAAGGAIGGALGSGILGRLGTKTFRGVKSGTAKIAESILGKSTGVGDDLIREASDVALKGGEPLKAFTNALRGKVAPEDIVNRASDALDQVVQKRNSGYVEQLSKIDFGQVLDGVNVQNGLIKSFQDAGVQFSPDGKSIDFLSSRIVGADDQKLIQSLTKVVENFVLKNDYSVKSLDNLVRSVGDQIPSKNVAPVARKLFTLVKKNAQEELNLKVPGYKELNANYSIASDFIDEIEKLFRLGGKENRDVAFKRLVSVLRDNQEFKQVILRDLDELTGGKLFGEIAGQQLSETISRGLVGAFVGASAVTALTGGLTVPLLIGALSLSPRAIGELIKALGLPRRIGKEITEQLIKIKESLGGEGVNLLQQRLQQGATKEIIDRD